MIHKNKRNIERKKMVEKKDKVMGKENEWKTMSEFCLEGL